MNTTNLGQQAESLVADRLVSDGYKIVARNWKRKICEIDIIASKHQVVSFVEVKYRSSSTQGGGLDYITPKKLKQLKFASKVWVSENNWEGDYLLLAASVKSDNLELVIEEILEIS